MMQRRYICDLRMSQEEDGFYLPAIQFDMPSLWIRAVEDHSADPEIPPGRVRCLIEDVDNEVHAQILAIPGVSAVG